MKWLEFFVIWLEIFETTFGSIGVGVKQWTCRPIFWLLFHESKQKRTHFTVYIMSVTSQEQQMNNSDWVNNVSNLPSENPPAYNSVPAPVLGRISAPPPTYDGKSNTTTQNQTVLPHANAQVAEPSVPVTRTESSVSNCVFQNAIDVLFVLVYYCVCF